MSSVPTQSTFSQSYKNANSPRHENSKKTYELEMKYLQEEVNYWKKEYSFNPEESILKKIEKVENEIREFEIRMQAMSTAISK